MPITGIKYDKCIVCEKCYDICPTDVLDIFAGKVYIKYPEDCQCCSLCIMVCPTEAILINNLRPRPLPSWKKKG